MHWLLIVAVVVSSASSMPSPDNETFYTSDNCLLYRDTLAPTLLTAQNNFDYTFSNIQSALAQFPNQGALANHGTQYFTCGQFRTLLKLTLLENQMELFETLAHFILLELDVTLDHSIPRLQHGVQVVQQRFPVINELLRKLLEQPDEDGGRNCRTLFSNLTDGWIEAMKELKPLVDEVYAKVFEPILNRCKVRGYYDL
eukprot:PhF_6_TR11223/c0_g1_i2/m.18098